MSFIKNISAFFLAFVILTGSVGIQIITDICIPCNHETVSVKVIYSNLESECHNGCHSDETHKDESSCCDKDHCNNKNHRHQSDIQVLNNAPEFFRSETNLLLKYTPVLLAVFDMNVDFFSIQQKRVLYETCKNSFKPPENYSQSFLCTYLI